MRLMIYVLVFLLVVGLSSAFIQYQEQANISSCNNRCCNSVWSDYCRSIGDYNDTFIKSSNVVNATLKIKDNQGTYYTAIPLSCRKDNVKIRLYIYSRDGVVYERFYCYNGSWSRIGRTANKVYEYAMNWGIKENQTSPPVVNDSLPLIGIPVIRNYEVYYPSRLEILKELIVGDITVKTLGLISGYPIYRFDYGTGSKKVVYIVRQHGSESAASFMAEGFLISSTKDLDFKNDYSMIVYPMVNSYGADRQYAYNILGQNINRFWNTTECIDTNLIRGDIEKIGYNNILLSIDHHALDGGEMFALVKLSTRENINKTAFCNIIHKYLPTYQCSVETCTAPNTVRGYLCVKGVKYNMVIEASMSNKTYTPEVTYNLGKTIKEIIKTGFI